MRKFLLFQFLSSLCFSLASFRGVPTKNPDILRQEIAARSYAVTQRFKYSYNQTDDIPYELREQNHFSLHEVIYHLCLLEIYTSYFTLSRG